MKATADASTDSTYGYDGKGWRISKTTGGSTRHYYYSSSWQVVEERVGSSTSADRQYVWGIRYVDELVERDRDADANTGNGLEERLYALQDANFNLTAIVNTSGAVQERYTYTAYGQRTILDGSWGSRSSSSYDWTVGHQGLTHDGESGLVYNRNRMLNTALGRFAQRDPLGYLDGDSLYDYERTNPVRFRDPHGYSITDCERGPGVLKCTYTAPLDDDAHDCEKYGNGRYLGVSLKCFCRSAGNSAWSRAVRGCLRCMDEEGVPVENAHELCYQRADRKHARPYLKLALTWIACKTVGP